MIYRGYSLTDHFIGEYIVTDLVNKDFLPGVHFSPGPSRYNAGILAGNVDTALGPFKPRQDIDRSAVVVALTIKWRSILAQKLMQIEDVGYFLGEVVTHRKYLTEDFLRMLEASFVEHRLDPCLATINEMRILDH